MLGCQVPHDILDAVCVTGGPVTGQAIDWVVVWAGRPIGLTSAQIRDFIVEFIAEHHADATRWVNGRMKTHHGQSAWTRDKIKEVVCSELSIPVDCWSCEYFQNLREEVLTKRTFVMDDQEQKRFSDLLMRLLVKRLENTLGRSHYQAYTCIRLWLSMFTYNKTDPLLRVSDRGLFGRMDGMAYDLDRADDIDVWVVHRRPSVFSSKFADYMMSQLQTDCSEVHDRMIKLAEDNEVYGTTNEHLMACSELELHEYANRLQQEAGEYHQCIRKLRTHIPKLQKGAVDNETIQQLQQMLDEMIAKLDACNNTTGADHSPEMLTAMVPTIYPIQMYQELCSLLDHHMQWQAHRAMITTTQTTEASNTPAETQIPQIPQAVVPTLSRVKHSHEEVRFTTYLLDAIGAPISLETLLEVILAGDAHQSCDAIIQIGEQELAIEWDEGFWHPKAVKDEVKTLEVLAAYPGLRMLRIRVGKAPPFEMSHPRCAVIHVPTPHTGRALVAAMAALTTLVPSARFDAVHADKRPECDDVAEDLHRRTLEAMLNKLHK